MPVKLFIETNLDTSLFLLISPDAEIKQVRDEIAKRLRQTNSHLADVAVERVKVLLDAGSAKRDRNNCFVVPDDYKLGSIVDGPAGRLFADCSKGKGTKRKREESKEATPKKPTAGPVKGPKQQQQQKQQQNAIVSPEHKKAKPATLAKTPVLQAPANGGGGVTSEKNKNKKKEKKNKKDEGANTNNNKQQEEKTKKNGHASPVQVSDSGTKIKKIHKKKEKKRIAEAAAAAAAAAATAAAAITAAAKADNEGAATPELLPKPTSTTEKTTAEAPGGTPATEGMSKSQRKRAMKRLRKENHKKQAEEAAAKAAETAAAGAEAGPEDEIAPTWEEIAAARAVIEEALADTKKEKKAGKKEGNEDSSPSDSDSPTPSPDALPAAAAAVAVVGTQGGSHVPPTQEIESDKTEDKSKKESEEEKKNKKESSKSGSDASSSSSSSSSSSDDDEDNKGEDSETETENDTKEKTAHAAATAIAASSPEKEEDKEEEEEDEEEEEEPSPIAAQKPRNAFHETDLKSLLKKAVSGKAGEKANLEQVRADAQKEGEQEKSEKSGGTRTTRSTGGAGPAGAGTGASKESFQWIRSHENFKGDDLRKLTRTMVRDVINADLRAQNKPDVAPNMIYKDGILKPDWWPLADFSSKAFDRKESLIKIYNAAREVLSKMHNVDLEGSRAEAAKAVAEKKTKNKK